MLEFRGQRWESDSGDEASEFMDEVKRALSHQTSPPPLIVSNEHPSVYVAQREFAAVNTTKHPHIEYLGSQDATTCAIVIFKSGDIVACVHLDGSNYPDYLVLALEQTFGTSATLETHIVGSYMDELGTSISDLDLLVNMMLECDTLTFNIQTCFILELNTTQITVEIDTRLCHERDPHYSTTPGTDGTFRKTITVNAPKYSSLAYEIKTGKLVCAQFEDDGPERCLRCISSFMGEDSLLRVYESELDQFVIGPKEDIQEYRYNVFDPHIIEQFLIAPDQLVLRYLSSSPYAEGKDFVKHMKENLQYMKDYPDCQVHFPDSQPIVYTRSADNKTWVRQ